MIGKKNKLCHNLLILCYVLFVSQVSAAGDNIMTDVAEIDDAGAAAEYKKLWKNFAVVPTGITRLD
jgi:hypothetical protein